MRRPNGLKAYTERELYKHLSEEDDELLAVEVWTAAKNVLRDTGEEYEASGAKLLELLFEHSLEKHNMWYVNKLHWLLNIGQPGGTPQIANADSVKQGFEQWKDTYYEVKLVGDGITEDDAIFSLQQLMAKFGPQMQTQ